MALADIALERLNRIAPRLSKRVVTFYDMSDDVPEEAGLQVGAFVLRVNSSEFYIPVVSKGGTVFPMDSIYSKSTGKFMPITKSSIDQVLSESSRQLGTGSKIPGTVNKNPSVRELVEPPRTGKYMYAGDLLPEALAQMSPAGKEWFLSKIASEKELFKQVHALGIDVNEMKSALSKTAEITSAGVPGQYISDKEVLNTDAPVRVVCEPEEGLEDEAIQLILSEGYAVIGMPQYPRTAIEFSSANDGFTRLPAAETNHAYEVVFRDGNSKIGFIPDMLRKMGLGTDLLKNRPNRPTQRFSSAGRNPTTDSLGTSMVIYEDGTYSHDKNIVIMNTPRDYLGAVKAMVDSGAFVSLDEVELGDKIMAVTSKGFAGPMRVSRIVGSEQGTILSSCGPVDGLKEIYVLEEVHGEAYLDGDSLFTNEDVRFLKLTHSCSDMVETDLNRAIARQNYTNSVFVKEAHTIDFDGVEFHVDRKPVGSIEKVAKVLAVDYSIDGATTSHFIKKAQEKGRIVIQMSKQGSINGIGPEDNSETTANDLYAPHGPAEIPEYGAKISPSDGNALSEREMQRGKKHELNTAMIKAAAATGDKQIVEASIMSELMKDPSMEETISSYMGSIDEALDKLGRSILLLRINNDKMLEKISPEELSGLISSLRNTYKLLGENKLTLEQLVTDGGQG